MSAVSVFSDGGEGLDVSTVFSSSVASCTVVDAFVVSAAVSPSLPADAESG